MDRAKPDGLVLRFFAAAVLIPMALAAAWFGGWPLTAVVALAAGAMGWEWGRMSLAQAGAASRAILIAAEIAAVVLAGLGVYGGALLVLAACALFLLAARAVRGDPAATWAAVGATWIGVPCVAVIWLGGNPAFAHGALIWIFVVVWATDTAAFAVGTFLGGPKLAPRWSPRKTWSGAIGGFAAAGLVGLIASPIMGLPDRLTLFWLSLALSIMAQLGDLAESAAKRHFGVKDSSNLIPGHGGVLDRLDGLLAAAVAAAGMALIGGGSLMSLQ